jgi:hypothetical protein
MNYIDVAYKIMRYAQWMGLYLAAIHFGLIWGAVWFAVVLAIDSAPTKES